VINISTALEGIIKSNYFLQFGIANRLLNLSQLAQFIKPLMEARTKKEIRISALKMNLSRLQKKYSKIMPQEQQFQFEDISISSNFTTITYSKNEKIRSILSNLYNEIKNENGFITLTEGTEEITLIVNKKWAKKITDKIKTQPKFINENISSIKVSFDEKYYYFPGIIYVLFQQLTMQGINIVELSSTFTELQLFLEEKDVKLAFDSLFNKFIKI
jgi:aspartokinase